MRAGSPRAAGSTACATCACKGAIGVVQLARAPQLEALRARFVRHGVWVRPFGDVVYLMPPLVIDAEDLERLIAAIHDVLREAAAAGEL